MYCPLVGRLLGTVLSWGGCYVLSSRGEAVMYCPLVGRLLGTVLVRVWLIACLFIHHWVAVCGSSVCDLVNACV